MAQTYAISTITLLTLHEANPFPGFDILLSKYPMKYLRI